MAAEKTGRRCRSIELNPKFADVIIARWEAHTQKDAIHARTGATFNDLRPGAPARNAGQRRSPVRSHRSLPPHPARSYRRHFASKIRERRRPAKTSANHE